MDDSNSDETWPNKMHHRYTRPVTQHRFAYIIQTTNIILLKVGSLVKLERKAILCYISPMSELFLATNNEGKIREYKHLLASLQIKLWTPHMLGIELDVREDGISYAENARLKALTYVQASGMPTLADDSGLEVDALGGAPGIHSARYAGDEADDAARYELLLQKLHDVPFEKRTARFRCVLVLATPTSELYSTEGVCEGIISFEPRGSHGFGYDPIFFLPEYGQTMAELPPELKNRISHRARAVQKMLPTLSRVLTGQI